MAANPCGRMEMHCKHGRCACSADAVPHGATAYFLINCKTIVQLLNRFDFTSS